MTNVEARMTKEARMSKSRPPRSPGRPGRVNSDAGRRRGAATDAKRVWERRDDKGLGASMSCNTGSAPAPGSCPWSEVPHCPEFQLYSLTVTWPPGRMAWTGVGKHGDMLPAHSPRLPGRLGAAPAKWVPSKRVGRCPVGLLDPEVSDNNWPSDSTIHERRTGGRIDPCERCVRASAASCLWG
jgi:hypothetical protein